MKRKPKFVAVEKSEWLVYAVLPHKGDGMTIEEISQVVKTIPTYDKGFAWWMGECLSSMDVEHTLEKLCEKGLVEVVETPEGKRYRRKFHNFKIPIKLCEFCGSPFFTRNMKRKFCSDSCRVRHHRWVCEKCGQRVREFLERMIELGRLKKKTNPDDEFDWSSIPDVEFDDDT